MLLHSFSAIQISAVMPSEKEMTANLLAKALATNPVHMAIFKVANAKTIAAQQKMFALLLDTHTFYAARSNGQMVGVMGFTSSTYCQLRPMQLVSVLPALFVALGRELIPVLQWRMNWKQHDPAQPHVHFGPLAVDPLQQGRGIGKALLQHFCDITDQRQEKAYLKTDKKENVTLYERFGFKVIKQNALFGVSNWFMLREKNGLTRTLQNL